MNVADLFISIGIKGNEKTHGILVSVHNDLKDIGSSALATKAAIVGAVYALEHLMKSSTDLGTNLTNFNTLTGVSQKAIQQWSYGLQQAGVSADEIQTNFHALQKTMTNMDLGKGAPEGLFMIRQATGMDLERIKHDMPYLMDKLREYAKMTRKSPFIGRANEWLRSFGVTDNFIAGAGRGLLDQNVRNKAPLISDGESAKLAKIGAEWANLWQKIQMGMAHLNAKHGGQLIKDLTMITTKLTKMIDLLTTLGEKLQVFKLIGKVFEGWGMIFDLANEEVDDVNKTFNAAKVVQNAKDLVKGFFSPSKEEMASWNQNPGWHAPMALPAPSHVNNTQTNHFHGVNDTQEVLDRQRDVGHAFYSGTSRQRAN